MKGLIRNKPKKLDVSVDLSIIKKVWNERKVVISTRKKIITKGYRNFLKDHFLALHFHSHKDTPDKRFFYIAFGIGIWVNILFLIPFLVIYIGALIAITFTSPIQIILTFIAYASFWTFLYFLTIFIASIIIGGFLWSLLIVVSRLYNFYLSVNKKTI